MWLCGAGRGTHLRVQPAWPCLQPHSHLDSALAQQDLLSWQRKSQAQVLGPHDHLGAVKTLSKHSKASQQDLSPKLFQKGVVSPGRHTAQDQSPKPTSPWPGRIVQGPASSPSPYPLLQEALLNLPASSTCPQHLVSAKALACYPLGRQNRAVGTYTSSRVRV